MSDHSLEELYSKVKITTSVVEAIQQKEDFNYIQPNYCRKICRLCNKSYESVTLLNEEVDILIVQENAAIQDGYKDAEKVERSNQAIITELCRSNFPGLTYRMVNLFKCQIKGEDIKKGKPPTSTVLMKCAPYLLQEIKNCNPKVIISLGTMVTKVLGLKKSNYTNRGEIHGNIVLTLHPKVSVMIRQNASGAMWGPDYWDIINRDFHKAAKLARGELVVPPMEVALEREKKNMFIARSIEHVKEYADFLLKLPESVIVSFDTETTGLDPWNRDAKLISIQFGFRAPDGRILSFVFPLWHRGNVWYNADEAWELIAPLLLGPRPKIGHNAKFDVLYVFATTGVRVQNIVFDTMLVLHNINSGIQGCYSLKKAVWDWLPETGFAGYEDLLPDLTKKKDLEEEDDTDVQAV